MSYPHRALVKFQTQIEISDTDIKNLLCSAFEGSISRNWCKIDSVYFPKGMSHADFDDGGKFQDPNEYWHWSQLAPLTPGVSLYLKVVDMPGLQNLDRAAIKRGLKTMFEKFPRHWSDFRSGQSDAITADVFLQCCLFGNVVYG